MKQIKDLVAYLRFKNELMALNKELKITSQIKHSHCQRQELIKKNSYNIAFIIPGMTEYSGGHTSILRLGTYLSHFGHNVFYITIDNSKRKEMEKNARTNLIEYEGTFLEKDDLKDFKFDIGIATLWKSCYWLLANQNNFDYKMYFIQDFEPYFYPVGDIYFLALNTYKLGFHMISLGKWNKLKIEEYTSKKADYIDFPVEIDQYPHHNKMVKIGREIKIALYLKLEKRRAPLLLIQQIAYLHDNLLKAGYEVKVYGFGLNKFMKLPFITNLGKLKTEKLKKLYSDCHFGIVASLTNISLVNYEMILSGLPVIDFADGSAPTFFSEKEMIFINSSVDDLFNKVFYYVDHQDELNEILLTAQNKIIDHKLTWENSSKQFHNIITKK